MKTAGGAAMDRSAPERLSHPARARRAPTDATRTMLDRLIVGLAEFSRRHALAVALGGLLLAAVSAFYAVTHLDVSTDTDRDVLQQPAVAAAVPTELNKEFPQFSDLLVAVIDAREPEQADATAAALADALGEGSRAFQLGAPAGRVALPAQGGPAVPRHEAADRPDGPYHRRAAVPRPAGRRSFRARAVLRAFTARHGRDQGRRRSRSLPRLARGVPSGDGRCAVGASAPAVVAGAAGRERAQRSCRQVHVRAGAAEARLRRAAARRRSDRRRCAASSPIWSS